MPQPVKGDKDQVRLAVPAGSFVEAVMGSVAPSTRVWAVLGEVLTVMGVMVKVAEAYAAGSTSDVTVTVTAPLPLQAARIGAGAL